MESIKLTNLDKSFSQKQLFSIRHLSANDGEKIAIIGSNGVGKSSLLKIMAGVDKDYKGSVVTYGEIAYVPQLKEESLLSGGEKVKHYLSKALFRKADILLLDEPSANLDTETKDWLIKQLKRYRGLLVMVSHDRDFMNQLSDKIWLLDEKTITVYPGNYSEFEDAKRTEKEHYARDYKAYQQKVERLNRAAEEKKKKAEKIKKRKKTVSSSDWKARSLSGNSDSSEKSMAKTSKSLATRLGKMKHLEKPKEEKLLKLKEVTSHVSSGQLLHLAENNLSVADKPLFSYPDLVIKAGEKIVLSGRNGSGKTSFVRQLFARTLDGTYSPRLRMAYFSQEFDQLNHDKTALENLMEETSQSKEDLINFLTALGFNYDQVNQRINHFSGGELVKLQLAKLLTSTANLIILDEPTNYLDLPTIISLERFIETYKGTLIVISHDKEFLSKISATRYRINDRRLTKE